MTGARLTDAAFDDLCERGLALGYLRQCQIDELMDQIAEGKLDAHGAAGQVDEWEYCHFSNRRVRIHGLTGRPGLNGTFGRVSAWMPTCQATGPTRFPVELHGDDGEPRTGAALVAIRAENLAVVPNLNSFSGRTIQMTIDGSVAEMKRDFSALRNCCACYGLDSAAAAPLALKACCPTLTHRKRS